MKKIDMFMGGRHWTGHIVTTIVEQKASIVLLLKNKRAKRARDLDSKK